MDPMRILVKGVGALCLTTLVGFAVYRTFYVLPFDQKLWLASKVRSEKDRTRQRMAPSIAHIIDMEHPSQAKLWKLLGPPDRPNAGTSTPEVRPSAYFDDYLIGIRPGQPEPLKVYVTIGYDENDRAMRAWITSEEERKSYGGFGPRPIPRGPDWSDFFGI